jgi:hypothetical protein
MRGRSSILGSARVSHAGFGVAPKQFFSEIPRTEVTLEVRDREHALARRREALA